MTSNHPEIEAKPRTEMTDIERAPSRATDVSDTLDPKYAVFAQDKERRQAVEKKLKRKLDMRCSLFFIIYIMNYLDRNNIVGIPSTFLIDEEAWWLTSRVWHVCAVCKRTSSSPIPNTRHVYPSSTSPTFSARSRPISF